MAEKSREAGSKNETDYLSFLKTFRQIQVASKITNARKDT